MKSVSIRMPEELLARLRVAAAKETIERNEQVSINTLAVEVLDKWHQYSEKERLVKERLKKIDHGSTNAQVLEDMVLEQAISNAITEYCLAHPTPTSKILDALRINAETVAEMDSAQWVKVCEAESKRNATTLPKRPPRGNFKA